MNAEKTLRILPNFDPTLISTLNNRLDRSSPGGLRAGVVAADNLLVYVTGGFATAQVKTTYSVVDTMFGTIDQAQFSEWVWGWTAGFGAEWSFWDRFSIRAEGLYMQFPERDLVFTTPNFGTAANVTHAELGLDGAARREHQVCELIDAYLNVVDFEIGWDARISPAAQPMPIHTEG